ncbi:ATP-grasp domain-containing protein [Streptomyces sp. NPDC049577]|uniref:ATP-grasp domain-containing protein n=1 Tax=Streptomyces sp. NPDC049577 TaxID=3155153 RepID=UPI003445E0F9
MSHLVFVECSGLGNRALEYARKKGHTTTLVWSPRYDFFATPEQRRHSRELADRAIRVEDPHDLPSVIAALEAAGVRLADIDAALTTMHPCVVPAAALAEAAGARGTSRAGIDAARDKEACRRILREQRIPSVEYAVVTEAGAALEAGERIGYPVVVKPVSGLAKTVTAMVHSPEEMADYFRQATARREALEPGLAYHVDGRFIIEEVAVGPLFSVEVATDGTAFTVLAAVRRKTGRDNPVLELGSTVPSGLGPEDERGLGEYAVRVCRALGLDLGIFHAEVILTRDGFRLVEVNPRVAGGTVPEVIRAATDCDLFEVLVELFEGNPVPAGPFPVRRAASHSFLAVDEEHTVRQDLPADWFEAFRPRLHSGSSSIAPGMRLAPMDGNFTTHGVVRVTAEGFTEAEAKVAGIRAEIGKLLDLALTPVAPSEVPS